jgi:hypothetical protein
MRHILSRTSDPPDLLGTCGSGFSGSYLYLLEDKDVVLLFDNDDAGQSGVKSIARRVKSSGHNIKSLSYIDWSAVTVSEHSELPKGYDVRDWYNASI